MRRQQEIRIVPPEQCQIRDDMVWAALCPVRLGIDDEVWLVMFDMATGAEIGRYPGTIVDVPQNRETGQYRLRLTGEGRDCLAPGWMLDYVMPMHLWWKLDTMLEGVDAAPQPLRNEVSGEGANGV
jgi:hypothetical protein